MHAKKLTSHIDMSRETVGEKRSTEGGRERLVRDGREPGFKTGSCRRTYQEGKNGQHCQKLIYKILD